MTVFNKKIVGNYAVCLCQENPVFIVTTKEVDKEILSTSLVTTLPAIRYLQAKFTYRDATLNAVSYTHLTLPTNREV